MRAKKCPKPTNLNKKWLKTPFFVKNNFTIVYLVFCVKKIQPRTYCVTQYLLQET